MIAFEDVRRSPQHASEQQIHAICENCGRRWTATNSPQLQPELQPPGALRIVAADPDGAPTALGKSLPRVPEGCFRDIAEVVRTDYVHAPVGSPCHPTNSAAR